MIGTPICSNFGPTFILWWKAGSCVCHMAKWYDSSYEYADVPRHMKWYGTGTWELIEVQQKFNDRLDYGGRPAWWLNYRRTDAKQADEWIKEYIHDNKSHKFVGASQFKNKDDGRLQFWTQWEELTKAPDVDDASPQQSKDESSPPDVAEASPQDEARTPGDDVDMAHVKIPPQQSKDESFQRQLPETPSRRDDLVEATCRTSDDVSDVSPLQQPNKDSSDTTDSSKSDLIDGRDILTKARKKLAAIAHAEAEDEEEEVAPRSRSRTRSPRDTQLQIHMEKMGIRCNHAPPCK